MKGFIAKTAASLGLGLGLIGCTSTSYRDLVDTCYPERYNAQARASVRETFNAQAANGHVLDQTVWTYMFNRDAKSGQPTDQLNPAGIEHLQYLSRRRPADLHIFLQTAQDIPYTSSDGAEKLLAARNELDQRRIQTVQAFLTTQLAPRGCTTPVMITLHDPAPTGMFATPITGTLAPGRELPIIGTIRQLQQNFQGSLPTANGGGTSSTNSSSGGGSGGSGGSSGGSSVGGR